METNWIKSFDGTKLFTAYVAGEKPHTLLWAHGGFEHQGRYREIIAHFAQLGYPSIAFDFRGHGESGGTRAYVRHFDEYVKDLYAVFQHYQARLADGLTIIGHSMGGLITIRFAETYPQLTQVVRYIVSSPFLGIKVQPPVWKTALSSLVTKVYPQLALPTGLSAANLTHDLAVVKAYEEDPKVSKVVTAGWYEAVLVAHKQVQAQATNIQNNMYILYAGEDKICNHHLTRTLYNSLSPSVQKLIKEYPGMYHEILNETNKQLVWEEIKAILQGEYEK